MPGDIRRCFSFLKQVTLITQKWGGRKNFPKKSVRKCLAKGMKTTDTWQKLNRDHQTVEIFVNKQNNVSDRGLLRKVSVRYINTIKRAAVINMVEQQTEAAGVSGVPRTSHCRIIQCRGAQTQYVFYIKRGSTKYTFTYVCKALKHTRLTYL